MNGCGGLQERSSAPETETLSPTDRLCAITVINRAENAEVAMSYIAVLLGP